MSLTGSRGVSLLKVSVVLALVVCLSSKMGGVDGAVISIDFSSEWLKIALVKPGVPMEIVLNKESKRKTAAIVALRNDERTFSDPASTVAVKYPKSAYRYIQLLTGLSFNNPLVAQYKQWFPFYDIRKDPERGTVVFKHDENTDFTPEELLGMLFNYSREISQDYAGTNIRDVIITIPAFFNQAQRRSVIQAAQLVGLNVLQLITDGAAVALNFGLYRQSTFNSTPFYVMFYDMGATSTTATIAEYKKTQVKEGGTAHIHPQVSIKGVGFDRTLGGLEMEIRLMKHLADMFTSKHKTAAKITESPRAMAKLLKEAKRVKKVLSANTEIFAQVEGLFEDIDFRTKVTRSEFEELCKDLFHRISDPVEQALRVADITLDEIESVILVGGGTRVPKVQEMLLKAVKKTELGKNVNTDEAAALGAVYQGASHTKLFRVKKFIVKDANVYPIQVSFERQNTDSDGNPFSKVVTRTLFNSGNPYPQKKVLTFNRYSTDFDFSVFYGDMSFLRQSEQKYIVRRNLTTVRLEGVDKALNENPEGEPGGIKVHFRMDESGLLNLDSMESLFDYSNVEEESTLSKLKNAFSNLFGTEETKQETEEKEKEKDGSEETNESPVPLKDKEEESKKEETTNEGQDTKDSDIPKDQDSDADNDISKDQDSDQSDQDGDNSKDQDSDKSDEDSDISKDQNEDSDTSQDQENESEELPDTKDDTPEEEEVNEQAPPTDDAKRVNESVSINGTTPNDTPTNQTSSKKAKKGESAVKSRTVKVNLTSSVTQLDIPDLNEKQFDISKTKLNWLQQRDEDKRENEQQKNNLESHIFETQDKMYTEDVMTHSTDEERRTILDALKVARDWLEDEGYEAETETYRQKFRELKRLSRPVFRRLSEALKRPRLMEELLSSLNRSYGMLLYMQNMTTEEEIFTKVEIKTLEDLTYETFKWYKDAQQQLNASKPYEDPVLLSTDIEEKIRKVDREVLYLINKVKNYRPKPKPKPKTNNTTTFNTSTDKSPQNNNTADTDGTTPVQEENNDIPPPVDDSSSSNTDIPLNVPPTVLPKPSDVPLEPTADINDAGSEDRQEL